MRSFQKRLGESETFRKQNSSMAWPYMQWLRKLLAMSMDWARAFQQVQAVLPLGMHYPAHQMLLDSSMADRDAVCNIWQYTISITGVTKIPSKTVSKPPKLNAFFIRVTKLMGSTHRNQKPKTCVLGQIYLSYSANWT